MSTVLRGNALDRYEEAPFAFRVGWLTMGLLLCAGAAVFALLWLTRWGASRVEAITLPHPRP